MHDKQFMREEALEGAKACKKGRMDRRSFLVLCGMAGIATQAVIAGDAHAAADEIIMWNWGGGAEQCHEEAFGGPLRDATGMSMRFDTSGPLQGRIMAMVDSGNVTADICDADLFDANLRGANLRWTNLCGANLSAADLFDATLRGAHLFAANLYGADLYDANLRWTNLSGATLWGTIGNMSEIKSAHFDTWALAWTMSPDGEATLQIGCQSAPLSKWIESDPDWIDGLDEGATEWWAKYRDIVLTLVQASPAVPYGKAQS